LSDRFSKNKQIRNLTAIRPAAAADLSHTFGRTDGQAVEGHSRFPQLCDRA